MNPNSRWKSLESKYRIDDEQKGSQAVVLKAFDLRLQREVAIKTPNDEIRSDPKRLERFIEEGRKLAMLRDEHVLSVLHFYEQGDIDDNPYLVTEYLDQTLKDVLREPLQPDATTEILRGILKGVKALHVAGIVHRDIKPENIFLSFDGKQVKIGDLGIASDVSVVDTMMATPKYAAKYVAPEVYRPDVAVYRRADIYSLGIIAYEMLLGPERFRQVFADVYASDDKDGQNVRWLNWHLDSARKPPPLHEVLPEIPPEVSSVVERMIAKDPEQRFDDAGEALRAIEAIGGPAAAPQPFSTGSPQPVQTPTAGKKWSVIRTIENLPPDKKWTLLGGVGGGLLLLLVLLTVLLSGPSYDMEGLDVLAGDVKVARTSAMDVGADNSLSSFKEAEDLYRTANRSKENKEYSDAELLYKEAGRNYRSARFIKLKEHAESGRTKAIEAGADKADPPIDSFARAGDAYQKASQAHEEAERLREETRQLWDAEKYKRLKARYSEAETGYGSAMKDYTLALNEVRARVIGGLKKDIVTTRAKADKMGADEAKLQSFTEAGESYRAAEEVEKQYLASIKPEKPLDRPVDQSQQATEQKQAPDKTKTSDELYTDTREGYESALESYTSALEQARELKNKALALDEARRKAFDALKEAVRKARREADKADAYDTVPFKAAEKLREEADESYRVARENNDNDKYRQARERYNSAREKYKLALGEALQQKANRRQIRARILEITKKLSCANVDFEHDKLSDHITLRGYVSTDRDLENLEKDIRAVPAVKEVDSDNIQKRIWPYCELEESLDQYVKSNSALKAQGLQLSPHQGHSLQYRAGENLVLSLRNHSSSWNYIYVDYYARPSQEGVKSNAMVQHMLPNVRQRDNHFQPGKEITLGLEGKIWTVAPPFGKEMIVVMASRSPLFTRSRDEVESVEGYLSSMRGRLNEVAKQGLLVDILPIETKPQ